SQTGCRPRRGVSLVSPDAINVGPAIVCSRAERLGIEDDIVGATAETRKRIGARSVGGGGSEERVSGVDLAIAIVKIELNGSIGEHPFASRNGGIGVHVVVYRP